MIELVKRLDKQKLNTLDRQAMCSYNSPTFVKERMIHKLMKLEGNSTYG